MTMGQGNPETNLRIAFEGIETVVDIGPRTIVSPVAAMIDQTKIRAEVHACRGCDARGGVATPTAAQYPTLNHRYAMVVPHELQPAERKLLVTAFKSGGLGVRPLENVAVIPRIGCTVDGQRAKKAHLAACYGHVTDQLWAANTNYVMLVGGDAKNLWRDDFTMDQIEGRVGVMWDRYVVMVIPSPAAVLAMPDGAKKRDKLTAIRRAVGLWSEVLDARLTVDADDADDPMLRPVTSDMARDCMECGRAAQEIDRDGLGWCRGHWADGRRRWRVARGVIGADGTGVML